MNTPKNHCLLLSSLSLLLALSSCDQVNSIINSGDPGTNPAVAAPTCTSAAYSDDSIEVHSATSGAKIFWRRSGDSQDIFKAYSRPIYFGEGGIEVFASVGSKDSSTITVCGKPTDIATSIPAPIHFPASISFDYLTDSIQINSPSPGASIHFTVDGSLPTISSPVFSKKLLLNPPMVVRAIAVYPGGHPSLPSRETYSLLAPWNKSIHYENLHDTRDGQDYPTIQLGKQKWMAKNLNWAPSPKWIQSPGYRTDYNEAEISDSLNPVCPEGWTIPNDKDWEELRSWLLSHSGYTEANFANALKATETWATFAGQVGADLFGFRAINDKGFWSKPTNHSDPLSSVNLSNYTGSWEIRVYVKDYSSYRSRFNALAEYLNKVRCIKAHTP